MKNNNFQEQILTMPEKLRHAFNFLRGKVLETVGHKRTKCAIEYKLFIEKGIFCRVMSNIKLITVNTVIRFVYIKHLSIPRNLIGLYYFHGPHF